MLGKPLAVTLIRKNTALLRETESTSEWRKFYVSVLSALIGSNRKLLHEAGLPLILTYFYLRLPSRGMFYYYIRSIPWLMGDDVPLFIFVDVLIDGD